MSNWPKDAGGIPTIDLPMSRRQESAIWNATCAATYVHLKFDKYATDNKSRIKVAIQIADEIEGELRKAGR